jgi:hypothetical protein
MLGACDGFRQSISVPAVRHFRVSASRVTRKRRIRTTVVGESGGCSELQS